MKQLQVHFVDSLSGAMNKRFTCYRCKRSLPESSFAFLGSRFREAKGRYGARKAFTMLHGTCNTCREQEKGRWVNHQLYTPELDRYWADMLRLKMAAAKQRGIIWALDKDDLIGKYLDQVGLCAYSGLQLNIAKTGPTTFSGTHLSAPSIDRIDSSGHYTPENIQIVMAAVNVMKGELSDAVFLELCRQITVNKMLT